MVDGGAILTLSYLGAVRVIPNYNVMGVAKASLEACVRYLAFDLGPKNIRVNAISAGPVKTASVCAAKIFRRCWTVLRLNPRCAVTPTPPKSPIQQYSWQVAWGRGVTGNVIYVDAGYHIMGLLSSNQPG